MVCREPDSSNQQLSKQQPVMEKPRLICSWEEWNSQTVFSDRQDRYLYYAKMPGASPLHEAGSLPWHGCDGKAN